MGYIKVGCLRSVNKGEIHQLTNSIVTITSMDIPVANEGFISFQLHP